MWPPVGGKVSLGGAALDQYGEEALARHIGWLPQEVVLFEGTVAENIARLDPEPDPDAVVEAAMRAGAHEMILALPGGYDFPVAAGGAALSGGQRQRIALARAFHGDPVLVILDEPDAHLDSEGAAALNRAIAALKAKGGSAVIVAHRPGSFTECDLVCLMERGQMRPAEPSDGLPARRLLASPGSTQGVVEVRPVSGPPRPGAGPGPPRPKSGQPGGLRVVKPAPPPSDPKPAGGDGGGEDA